MNDKTNPLFWKFCSIRWVESRPEPTNFSKNGRPVGRPSRPGHWDCCVKTDYGTFALDFGSRVRAAEYADIVKLALLASGIIKGTRGPVKFNFPRDHYPENIETEIGRELRKFIERTLFNMTPEGIAHRAARFAKAAARAEAKRAAEQRKVDARIDEEASRMTAGKRCAP